MTSCTIERLGCPIESEMHLREVWATFAKAHRYLLSAQHLVVASQFILYLILGLDIIVPLGVAVIRDAP